jgi:hypothetical protein
MNRTSITISLSISGAVLLAALGMWLRARANRKNGKNGRG